MLKTTTALVGAGLCSLVLSGVANAQETATLVLQNGERPSGELVDLNASGFTLRVSGQDRQFSKSDVRAVEFVVGAPAPEAQARVNAGQALVILRSGQVVEGQLSDVGGSRPLRLTIDTAGGQREFTSNDVAQIHLGGRGAAQGVGTAGPGVVAGAPGAVTVQGNQPWTDAEIIVARGERLQFGGGGDIMIGANASSGVGGSPAVTAPTSKYPVANAPVGALIGRIGNSAPFLIGANNQPMTMPVAGRLMLGVNDDHFPDNSGAYSVTITRLGR
ncbi:MAG: hypothetical protein GEU82_09130 [Luteitalea sp.]|nr:hypothetical protein [Luteitalea sp.]